MYRILIVGLICFSSFVFADQKPETVSLLGTPLHRPELDTKTREEFELKLAQAKVDYDKNPTDASAAIWLGRRTAYLGRYQEAIEIYTRAIDQHREDPRLYRHRGHRYLTVREIDLAIRDFEKAAELVKNKGDEVEPDGLPNAKNIPTSTLKTNIFYHLGLSYYLKADFPQAEKAYRKCLMFSKNDDMLVAVTHWLYMTLRRQAKTKEAALLVNPIGKDMNVIEDFDYQMLCLLYKGEKRPDDLLEVGKEGGLSGATISYGVANWYLYNGQTEKAVELFRRIVAGKEWASFGYLASEAELARMEKK